MGHRLYFWGVAGYLGGRYTSPTTQAQDDAAEHHSTVKKEGSPVFCDNMGKPDTESQLPHNVTYTRNLKIGKSQTHRN